MVIVVVGVLVAGNLAILAARSVSDDRPGVERPTAIVALLPQEGELIRPQEQIGVQLRSGLQGLLSVNGRPIPPDETDGDPGLGQVLFRPGPGKELRELPEGAASARVEYWPTTLSYEQARERDSVGSFSWYFKVG